MPADQELLHLQLLQIERAVRHIRLQLHAEEASPPFGGSTTVELPNDLSELLRTKAPLANRELGPYEEFFRGLRFGYPTQGGRNSVSVTQFVFDRSGNHSSFAATLGVDVNLAKGTPLPWLCLEIPLDVTALRNAKALEATFGLSFRAPGREDLGHYSIALRLKNGDSYQDYIIQRFPAQEIPAQVTYELTAEALAQIPIAEFSASELMLNLPANRSISYRVYVSHAGLEIKCEG